MSYIGYLVKDAQGQELFVNGIRRSGLFNYQFELVYPLYYHGIDFDTEYLNLSRNATVKLAKKVKVAFKNTPFEIVAFYGLISDTEMEEIYTGENLPMIKEIENE